MHFRTPCFKKKKLHGTHVHRFLTSLKLVPFWRQRQIYGQHSIQNTSVLSSVMSSKTSGSFKECLALILDAKRGWKF